MNSTLTDDAPDPSGVAAGPGSPAGPAASPRLPGRQPNWWAMGCLGVFVLLLVSLIGLLVLFSRMPVRGEEFDPFRFQTRSFAYLQRPGQQVPLGKRTVEETTSAMLESLTREEWIEVDPDHPPRWDLVRDNWPRNNSPDFDAAILLGWLELRSTGGGYFWEQWNSTHPDHAAAFWPVIAEFARAGQYVLTSDLFRMAMESDPQSEAEKFSRALDELAGKLLLEQARLELECGRPDAARAAAELSNRFDPNAEAARLASEPEPEKVPLN